METKTKYGKVSWNKLEYAADKILYIFIEAQETQFARKAWAKIKKAGLANCKNQLKIKI